MIITLVFCILYYGWCFVVVVVVVVGSRFHICAGCHCHCHCRGRVLPSFSGLCQQLLQKWIKWNCLQFNMCAWVSNNQATGPFLCFVFQLFCCIVNVVVISVCAVKTLTFDYPNSFWFASAFLLSYFFFGTTHHGKFIRELTLINGIFFLFVNFANCEWGSIFVAILDVCMWSKSLFVELMIFSKLFFY